MFGFHKPKMYRSLDGCCICRAKSSSSRFTDSKRYEKDFRSCFELSETRSGEICNACVLLVKRWKKLPVGTKKNWNHVVDARGGPSLRMTSRPKKIKSISKKARPSQISRLQKELKRNNSDAHSTTSSASPAQSPSYSNLSDDGSDSELSPGSSRSPVFSFLDLTYWKRQKVCCGIIYKGRFGEVLIDPHLFKPCCRNKQRQQQQQQQRRGSREQSELLTHRPCLPGHYKKVQWLLDNYETAEGVSLPRSTLYCHYLLHCQEQKLEPVNAASFGKLIRSVFMGLRTRRLGTRGNSKYHYYGLRIKAGSSLLRLMEDQQHLAMRQQPFSQKQRLKPVHKVEGMTNGTAAGSGQQQQQQQGSGHVDISTQVQQYQQFLDASRALPEFPDIDLQGKALPEGIELEHIKSFQLLYREHCEAIVDVMVNLQFTLVETLWKTFWRFSQSQSGDTTMAVHDESEKRLPKSCLVLLCKYEPVLRWSRDCDNGLYQSLVEILIPDVLRPIPSALTQAIRNFAKSLESWLTNAMMNIPEEMVRIKVTSANAFAQTLRRYTSLNHLAQAARAVLQNTAQINQMLSDLNRVDFANVQEQASWVCRCEDRVVQRLEQDFKLTLQQQNSLEQWAVWLDGVVSQVLKPYQQSPAFPKAAKLFLLKWSFYSSMVIRDLTLRSAASFGSFHLIRLLYDEYMYYLIEHRVAQAKGETPIAVMGEFASLGRGLNTLDPDKEEEDEEDEESEEEGQELSLPSDGAGLGEESLEPPAKLARTDQRVLFTTGSADN
uniref:Regulatory factor X, 1a (Influences HLA class II expression) n=2 Tax=Nothobranchius rachovii TaxID=451742 RepID=A0A1A8RE86_9TELE